jgi:parvulin-like peptidyl-prolyl isomerase
MEKAGIERDGETSLWFPFHFASCPGHVPFFPFRLMMKFLRSQSQTVLIVILGVIGASFLFYGNVGNLLTGSGGRGNDFGRIDGQDLSVAELYDAVRSTRDALVMSGHAQQLSAPGGRAAIAQEAWRQLLLLHEADSLHIQLTDQELIDDIHNQPIFQKNGVYSPELYQAQMTTLQNTFHISPDAFEEVVRNSLRTDAVSKALFSTVRTSVRDVSAEYEKYDGATQVSEVIFDPKMRAATTPVSPDEIAAEYKAHPDNPAYRTPEKRKVDYILLPLAADQAMLPAKEKNAAIEALGEKALDFVLALQPEPANGGSSTPPDFFAEAKKRGLNPQTTDFFAADAPPAGLPPSPAFNSAAFSLSKENPVSKVVELDNGVAVLHLDDVQPSELKPLDEVKGEITRQLQQTKAVQETQVAAEISAQSMRAQLAKGGGDFKALAAAQKLNVQTLPSFIPTKVSQNDERLATIAYASTELPVGGISNPIPLTGDTVAIIHVDSRQPADPSGLAAFELRFREKEDEQVRNLVYVDWAEWMSKRPGTHKPPELDQYGGVE